MMTQSLWDTAKAVLRGKLIAIQCHLKKQEKSQNNITLYLKQPENCNNRVRRNHKDPAELNEVDTKKTVAKISKTKSWFSEKIKLINF